MKIKQRPEDFIVDEIFDYNKFYSKDEKVHSYDYFILWKYDYTTLKAIRIVAKCLNTSIKKVHFSGTKDKVAITTQVISVYNPNGKNFSANVKFLNEKYNDLNLKYLGNFNGRINLGDNSGNAFRIIVRDLNDKDLRVFEKIEVISEEGILNIFDDQRFGYAKNSHKIGLLIIQNRVADAVKEILTSIPENFKYKELTEDNKKFIFYVDLVNREWLNIKEGNIDVINRILDLIPEYLENDKKIFRHLQKFKNDFPGAFRTIPKKLRTLYINAFQSYIFNQILFKLEREDLLKSYDFLELISFDTDYDERILSFVNDLFKELEVSREDLLLKHMPELKLFPIKRKTRIFPRNVSLSKYEEDELNLNKYKIALSFELESGEYATNVIKHLFNNF